MLACFCAHAYISIFQREREKGSGNMPVLVNNGRKFKWTLCGKLKLNYEFRPRKIHSMKIGSLYIFGLCFRGVFGF